MRHRGLPIRERLGSGTFTSVTVINNIRLLLNDHKMFYKFYFSFYFGRFHTFNVENENKLSVNERLVSF